MTMEISGHDQTNHDDDHPRDDHSSMSSTTQAPCCVNIPVKPLVIFAVCLVGSVLFSVLKDQSTKNIWTAFDFKPVKTDQGENRSQQVEVEQDKLSGGLLPQGLDKKSSLNVKENHTPPVELRQDKFPQGLDKKSSLNVKENRTRPVELRQDKFLGGLIPEGFEDKSCLSRYQSFWNRKGPQTHRPSSHLISRLRNYEALHKRCGPRTKSFSRALERLKSGNYSSSSDCKYVVWIAREGLGNRMITLVSAFLYALLTQKVLLVDRGAHISDLFCEPFPESSWLIPSNFPPIINGFKSFHKNSLQSYGNMLKKKQVFGSSNGSLIPPYVYLYLIHNYDDDDKRFFCDEDQPVLQKVPWLIIKSDIYYVPSFFLMPSFRKELSNLFPEKETVFHFLGRYLFHPANSVWKSITRYYHAHLVRSDEKIGLQIRIFKTKPDPFDKLLHQILACVIKENILPQINEMKTVNVPSGKSNKTISVLMASLSSRYHDAVKEMYGKHPTLTGEIIQVHQPSNEVHQHSEKRIHNMKAWEEMYLLSLTDKLVTSSKSTFGYVAQSLGGLKPWILYRPEEYTSPNPGCQRARSMEPCFQAPPMFDCKTRERIDTGKIVGFVRHCEDMSWTRGLKLFDGDAEP